MQVLIILLLFFVDVGSFGCQPLWNYPTWIPLVLTSVSVALLFTPYLRTPCYDESSMCD